MFTAELCSWTRFSPADILVLASGAIPPTPAIACDLYEAETGSGTQSPVNNVIVGRPHNIIIVMNENDIVIAYTAL